MPTAQVVVETTLPPDKVREALIDFSGRRPDLWPDLDRDQYEVREVAATNAVIREGSRLPGMTIWAVERYDWSEPDTVSWTVIESNFCTPGDRVIATIRPRDDGGTSVHLDWARRGTTLAGKLLVGMIGFTKGAPLRLSTRKAFERLTG